MLGRPTGGASSHGKSGTLGAAPLSLLAARYGFRRIESVHLRVGDRTSTATVTGIAHRYPCSVRVPLSVAHRLVAAGARLTIERLTPSEPTVQV